MEYDVIWGNGQLGVTLRPDKLGEHLSPVVGRINASSNGSTTTHLEKVRAGHALIRIGEHETNGVGYDQTVEILKSVERPVILRFRAPGKQSTEGEAASLPPRSSSASSSVSKRSRPPRHSNYKLKWDSGPLGLILVQDQQDCHVPCIRQITGKGRSAGIENARLGDILVKVNDEEAKSIGFRSTISLLKTIKKPATLTFKSMNRRLSRSARESNVTAASAPSASRRRRTNRSPSPSPPSRSASNLSQAPREEYTIVWKKEDLGLKLRKSRGTGMPVISRLTGKGNPSGVENAKKGDELVSINNESIASKKYKDILNQLRHTPKPAILRFVPAENLRAAAADHLTKASIQSDPSSDLRQLTTSLKIPRAIKEEERPKKKRTDGVLAIKMSVAMSRQLVCHYKKLNPVEDSFKGVKLSDVAENTKEAKMLRAHARKYIYIEAKNRGKENKDALSAAEQETKVLAETLEKIKEQAKVYDEMLAAKQKEKEKVKIISAATKTKSKQVVGMQNIVIAELAGVISDFKRDTYSDVGEDLFLAQEEEEENSMRKDLKGVLEMTDNVKACGECGALESEIALEMDEDNGEWYCLDCWEGFEAGGGNLKKTEEEREKRDLLGKKELVNALQKEEERLRQSGDAESARLVGLETRRLSKQISEKEGLAKEEEDENSEDEDYWTKKREEAQQRIKNRHAELQRSESDDDDRDDLLISKSSSMASNKVDAPKVSLLSERNLAEAVKGRIEEEGEEEDLSNRFSEATVKGGSDISFAVAAREMDKERAKALERKREFDRKIALDAQVAKETEAAKAAPEKITTVLLGDEELDRDAVKLRAEKQDEERLKAYHRMKEKRSNAAVPGEKSPKASAAGDSIISQKKKETEEEFPSFQKIDPIPPPTPQLIAEDVKEDSSSLPRRSSNSLKQKSSRNSKHSHTTPRDSKASSAVKSSHKSASSKRSSTKVAKTSGGMVASDKASTAEQQSRPSKEESQSESSSSSDYSSISDYSESESDYSSSQSSSSSEDEPSSRQVRRVANKNMALAQQINEASKVVERVRQSLNSVDTNELPGVESPKVGSPNAGLSDKQVRHFQRLVEKREERRSFVKSNAYDDDSSSSEEIYQSSGDENDDESSLPEDPGVWI